MKSSIENILISSTAKISLHHELNISMELYIASDDRAVITEANRGGFMTSPVGVSQDAAAVGGKLLLIYICNFHVLSDLLLIYICKLHWNFNSVQYTRKQRKKYGIGLQRFDRNHNRYLLSLAMQHPCR